ncbi:MAG TPA: hypothetical protein VMT54_09080 [Candidatus Cybelea sp.]|nr:hypothetical protein [Candidatus Cybelea sp.]
MGLFVVFTTGDVRALIAGTCRSFYVPFRQVAVVSFNGSADQLARHLGLGEGGGPGALILGAKPIRHIVGQLRDRITHGLAATRRAK